MNKDTVKSKIKDIEGRVQRQAGEWTGINLSGPGEKIARGSELWNAYSYVHDIPFQFTSATAPGE